MAINLKSEADKALAALNEGRANSAFKIARGALRKHPNEPFFNNLAGLALCAQDKRREALPYFQKAMRANPEFLEAQKNLAQTLVLLGEQERAQVLLRRLASRLPRDAELAYMLAQSLVQGGQPLEAETEASRALSLDPAMAKALNLRGILRRGLSRHRDSIDDLRRALELQPDAPEVMGNLANSLTAAGRSDEALELLARARALAPKNLTILHRWAGLNTELGRKAEAADAYREMLRLDPGHAAALANLARLASPDEGAAMIADLRALHDRLPARDPGRVELGFALWTLLRQAGELQQAEAALVRANGLASRLRPFDAERCAQTLTAIRRDFPHGGTRPANTGDNGPRPIFVLGLIRSGTTLTEAILAASPEVAGLGESGVSGRLVDEMRAQGARFDAARFARDYRAELPEMEDTITAFTDKMPDNFERIGYLLSAFPDCRIINLSRDPRDTALSIYANNLPDAKLAFSTDLHAMARYFNYYAEVMAHWRARFPGAIIDWSYEEMVRDVDTASRRLAEHCGIRWTPGMATPDQSERAVLTASALQVKQKVHSRSVGGWKRHEALLAPFTEGLDPALWPEIAPG